MQTVNFQCGHCGNLMAVSVEYLGQQVRCPTCQQVVLAPAATPPAPSPAPAPSPPPPPEMTFREDHTEDIFHTPSDTEDALFGADEGPKLEFPRDPVPAPPSPPPEPPVPEPPAPALEPMTFSPFAEQTKADEPEPTPAASENGTAALPWAPTGVTADVSPSPLTESIGATTPRRVRSESGVNWFFPLVFMPLVVYAIGATAVAGFIYVRWKAEKPSLFDQMPDVEGDTPGARKEKRKVRLTISRKLALAPLPERLHVPLGETIQIGDLRVTPKKIERRKVSLLAETAPDDPAPSEFDALVLTLHLKNTSSDYAFTPLDNYFDRKWVAGNDESVPLTVLVAGDEAFFGGPAKWFPLRRDPGKRQDREWLQGRKNVDRVGLLPGAEMETIIATDGWNAAVASFLFGTDAEGRSAKAPYRGKLLWRVQVRRGVIDWRGKDVPATAVIGVEFDHSAYTSKAS